MSVKGLYKFHWDCGRMGEVNGIFIATDEQVQGIIGKTVYFGEILGKHSEVYGEIKENEISLITQEENVIETVEKHSLQSGHNPFHYYDPEP